MRKIQIGTQNYTQVFAIDESGPGGANHQYVVMPAKNDPHIEFASVTFQNGPIKESGINGCHNEDLLAIVIDRLQSFQSGEFSCRENALALTKVQEAMFWLRHRTEGRESRGVEGTSQK